MTEIIGLPTLDANGLQAQCSTHFGGSPYFTFVTLDDGKATQAKSLENPGPGQAGCMGPVLFMQSNNATKVIALGIGGRPMMGFTQVGIDVFHGIEGTVEDNIQAYLEGKLSKTDQATCLGRQG